MTIGVALLVASVLSMPLAVLLEALGRSEAAERVVSAGLVTLAAAVGVMASAIVFTLLGWVPRP